MPSIAVTSMSTRTPAEAFSLAADRENAAAWDPRVREVRAVAGAAATVGFTFDERRRVGRGARGVIEAIERDALLRMLWTFDGEDTEQRLREEWRFTRAARGTRVTLRVEAVMSPDVEDSFLVKTLVRVGLQAMRGKVKQQLDVFVSHLEAEIT